MKIKVNENIDSNKIAVVLAGHICEVLQESANCYLVRNDSPWQQFGDPETVWVWKTDCVVVEKGEK